MNQIAKISRRVPCRTKIIVVFFPQFFAMQILF